MVVRVQIVPVPKSPTEMLWALATTLEFGKAHASALWVNYFMFLFDTTPMPKHKLGWSVGGMSTEQYSKGAWRISMKRKYLINQWGQF